MSAKYAIIGGSQGFRVAQKIGGVESFGAVSTPYGDSAPVHKLTIHGRDVLFISRHGESGYSVSAPFVNYRANIWALKELGVEKIVAWSGPGAIDPSISIGSLLVPGDILDETKNRDYTFFDGLGIGFIRQNPVFCPDLAQSLRSAILARQGSCRTEDVYVCTQGPRLETPAEIKKYAMLGGTLVGMTLVPEAFLAKELEMCYCPVCYVTNYAEGVKERAYKAGELFEGLSNDEERAKVDAAVEMLPEIAIEALFAVQDEPACKCGLSMERYRRRGDIGEDWRTWIRRPE